ncbi:MAG: bifunctional 4-hydroxy-2-oxoglutarate aldolase/2-dehydro-3-deoxy-phosphogluconate aldolase [Sphaerochaetaceae bacterium]|nr:bifunctional 4-hydroxy-2-oxoglutarate aldolase/2-dehydro-3-deoxy-phosphogluconate aldolase [Sphaerochaetaceae bacterium]
MDLEKTIANLGLVPVIVINNADRAEGLAKALIDGGIPCAEVTFRTAAAAEAIKRMVKAYPEMLVGAGTVLNVEQAKKAVEAGAKFIVSPGLDVDTVKWAQENNVPVYPGVCTASEVQKALNLGLNILKFFPAEASGGVPMINNLCGPFPQVKFMTTGGISTANLAEYASCPHVLAIGGSWMAKADMIENECWDQITDLCRQAVVAVHGFSIAHFGMNAQNPEDAKEIAKCFSVFGLKPEVGNSSTFMNKDIEIMHQNGKGVHGHIGFRTHNVDRAAAYLAQFGFTVNESTVKKDAKGNTKFCYFNETVGGFAIHLVK